ncbi:Hypothetical protein GLP15_2121 [Giardia lamblia P15]|uniref:Uncharacterized protein n=1 Tax=Giardia intestinalis (strain P15) TaxID=658858 RepID=E1EY92_GIAIA|nr:Hypothetical protein GLP15_2121 [Giardia lamblia P15]
MTHRTHLTGDSITQQIQNLILTTAPSHTRRSSHHIGSDQNSAVHGKNPVENRTQQETTLEQKINTVILNSRGSNDRRRKHTRSHSKQSRVTTNLHNIPPLPRHAQSNQPARMQPSQITHSLACACIYPDSSLLSSTEASLTEAQSTQDLNQIMQRQIEALQQEVQQLQFSNTTSKPKLQSEESSALEALHYIESAPVPMPRLDQNIFSSVEKDLLGSYPALDLAIENGLDIGLDEYVTEHQPTSMPLLNRFTDVVELADSYVKESSTLEDPIKSPYSIDVLSNVMPKHTSRNDLHRSPSISVSLSSTVSPTMSIINDLTFSEEQIKEELLQRNKHLSKVISPLEPEQYTYSNPSEPQLQPICITKPPDCHTTDISISPSAHGSIFPSNTESPSVTLTEDPIHTTTLVSSTLSPTLTTAMTQSISQTIKQREQLVSPVVATAVTSIRKLLPSTSEPFIVARRVEKPATRSLEQQRHAIHVPAYTFQHLSKPSSEEVAVLTNTTVEEQLSEVQSTEYPTSGPILHLERLTPTTDPEQSPDSSRSVVAIRSPQRLITTQMSTSLARPFSAQPAFDKTFLPLDTDNASLTVSRMARSRPLTSTTSDIRAQSAYSVRKQVSQTLYSSHLPMKHIFFDPSSSAIAGTTAPVMRSAVLTSGLSFKEVPQDHSSLFQTTRGRLREDTSDIATTLLPITSLSLSPKTIPSYSLPRKKVENDNDLLNYNACATYAEEYRLKSQGHQKPHEEKLTKFPVVQFLLKKPILVTSGDLAAISVTKEPQTLRKQSQTSLWTHTRVSSQIMSEAHLKNCPIAPELSSFELHKNTPTEPTTSSTSLSFNDTLQVKRPPPNKQGSYQQSNTVLNSFIKEPIRYSSHIIDLTKSCTPVVPSSTFPSITRAPLPKQASATKQFSDAVPDYHVHVHHALKSPVSPFDDFENEHLSAGSKVNELSAGIERVSSEIVNDHPLSPEIIKEISLKGPTSIADSQETSYSLQSLPLNDPTIRRQYTPSFSINESYCSSTDETYYSSRCNNGRISEGRTSNKALDRESFVYTSETPDPNQDALVNHPLGTCPYYQQDLLVASSDLLENMEVHRITENNAPRLTVSSLDTCTMQPQVASFEEARDLSPAPCYFTEPEESLTIDPVSPAPAPIPLEDVRTDRDPSGSIITLSGLGSAISPFPSLENFTSPKALAHTRRIRHTMEILNELQAELSPNTQLSATLPTERSQTDNTAEGSFVESISLNISTTPFIKKMQQQLLGAKTLIPFVDIGQNDQSDLQGSHHNALVPVSADEHEDVAVVVVQNNKFLHNPHVQGRKSTGYEFYSSIEQGSAILLTNRAPYSSSTSMFRLDGCSTDFNYRQSLDRYMLLDQSHLPSATPSLMYDCANDTSISGNRLDASEKYTHSGVNFAESSCIAGIEAHLTDLQLNIGPLDCPILTLAKGNQESFNICNNLATYLSHLNAASDTLDSNARHGHTHSTYYKLNSEDSERLNASMGKIELKKCYHKEALVIARQGIRSADHSICGSFSPSCPQLPTNLHSITSEIRKPRQLTAVHNPRATDIIASLSELSASEEVQNLTNSHAEASTTSNTKDSTENIELTEPSMERTRNATDHDNYLSDSVDSFTVVHDNEIIEKIYDLECEKNAYNIITEEKCKSAQYQHSVYLSAMSLLTDSSVCSLIDNITREASIAEVLHNTLRHGDTRKILSPNFNSTLEAPSCLHLNEKSPSGMSATYSQVDALHESITAKSHFLLSNTCCEEDKCLLDTGCGSPYQSELQATTLIKHHLENQLNTRKALECVAYSMYYVSREARQLSTNATGAINQVSKEDNEVALSTDAQVLRDVISFLRGRWMMAEEDLIAQKFRSERYMAQQDLLLNELKSKIVDRRRLPELEIALSQMHVKEHTILANNVEYYGEEFEKPRRWGFCGSQLPRRRKQVDRMVVKTRPQLVKSQKNEIEVNKVLAGGTGEEKMCKDENNGLKSKTVNKKTKQRIKNNLLMGLFKPKDKEATTNVSISYRKKDVGGINPINISIPVIAEESVPSEPKSIVEETGASQDTYAILNTADKLLRDIWGGNEGQD